VLETPWFRNEQFLPWWRLQEGDRFQPVKKLAEDPMWFKDSKMTPFRQQTRSGVYAGYASPPNEKWAPEAGLPNSLPGPPGVSATRVPK